MVFRVLVDVFLVCRSNASGFTSLGKGKDGLEEGVEVKKRMGTMVGAGEVLFNYSAGFAIARVGPGARSEPCVRVAHAMLLADPAARYLRAAAVVQELQLFRAS